MCASLTLYPEATVIMKDGFSFVRLPWLAPSCSRPVGSGIRSSDFWNCKIFRAHYGRFLGGKWSEHENRKSEIRKSENRKSIIY
jgi:hypothetical protein